MKHSTVDYDSAREALEISLEQAILKEIPEAERGAEYLSYAKRLVNHLDQDEQMAFLNDPINFLSSKNLFRGFPPQIYERIQDRRLYEPQSGEHGSEGVYFSNRPYSAFTYQKEGAMAIIDPTKLKYKSEHGILDVSSKEYIELSKDYINRMLPMAAPTNRSDFFYQVQNQWDSARGVSKGPSGEKIIEMRLPQPIEITKVFLVWSKDGILEVKV